MQNCALPCIARTKHEILCIIEICKFSCLFVLLSRGLKHRGAKISGNEWSELELMSDEKRRREEMKISSVLVLQFFA